MSRELISIVACTVEGGIGVGNKLPWHLPEDMKRFVNETRGHSVIMGRKTYESIGKPLPNRRNVVISRNFVPQEDSGVIVVGSVAEALELTADDEKTFIIGGAIIYNQTIFLVDKVILTYVVLSSPKEYAAYFPIRDLYLRLSKNPFALLKSENVVCEPKDKSEVSCYTFLTFDFKNQPGNN